MQAITPSTPPDQFTAWMTFLNRLEDEAAAHAAARGKWYTRCPDDILATTARLAVTHGHRLPGT
jgi:hypothetical protein